MLVKALASHYGTVEWITHASIHRMLSNTVAKAINGSFKTEAPRRRKQTWGTQRVMTNTLVIVYHRTAPIMLRELKLWWLQRAKEEQPGPEECSEMPPGV